MTPPKISCGVVNDPKEVTYQGVEKATVNTRTKDGLLTFRNMAELQLSIIQLEARNNSLEKKLSEAQARFLSMKVIKNYLRNTVHDTGFQSAEVFQSVFNYLAPWAGEMTYWSLNGKTNDGGHDRAREMKLVD